MNPHLPLHEVSKPGIPKLTRKDIDVLARAVDEAESWRGSLVGNPDPAPLAEFDRFIKDAKATLKKVRKIQRGLK